jgi:hypothetical protein
MKNFIFLFIYNVLFFSFIIFLFITSLNSCGDSKGMALGPWQIVFFLIIIPLINSLIQYKITEK